MGIVFIVLLLSFIITTFSSHSVHVFYYLWYGNPGIDGEYKHWNHEVLPHWEDRINSRYSNIGIRYEPPNNLHSPYYPLRGPYSSRNISLLKEHFKEIKDAGSSVIIASWWGQRSKPYATDTQKVNTDENIAMLLMTADEDESIKIGFHLEPYPSRSAESVYEDIKYIIDIYGHHRSLYRSSDGRPIFYVYDSYHIPRAQWSRLLKPDGDLSIRGTMYDSVFIGLWLDHHHGVDLHEGGFDGIYTYFAATGFSYGSTTSNWNNICSYCRKNNLLCSLSVGPGYDDSGIRPWNRHNTRERRDGNYYREQLKQAIAASPTYLSVTSYNEWGEGTQIEAARRTTNEDNFEKVYNDYSENGIENPYMYINITQYYSRKFTAAEDAEL